MNTRAETLAEVIEELGRRWVETPAGKHEMWGDAASCVEALYLDEPGVREALGNLRAGRDAQNPVRA